MLLSIALSPGQFPEQRSKFPFSHLCSQGATNSKGDWSSFEIYCLCYRVASQMCCCYDSNKRLACFFCTIDVINNNYIAISYSFNHFNHSIQSLWKTVPLCSHFIRMVCFHFGMTMRIAGLPPFPRNFQCHFSHHTVNFM